MKYTFLFIEIIIFFNLINEIFFMICEKEKPIFKENECVSVYCNEDQFKSGECSVNNPIMKTKWLNKIITFENTNGDLYLSVNDDSNKLIFVTTLSNDEDRIYYEIQIDSKEKKNFIFEKNGSFVPFIKKNIDRNENKKIVNAELSFLKISENDNFIILIGGENSYIEILKLEEYSDNLIVYNSTDFIGDDKVIVGISHLSYHLDDSFIYVTVTSPKDNPRNYSISFYKYLFTYEKNNNSNVFYNRKGEYHFNNIKGNYLSCFDIPSLKYISCFYLSKDNNYTISLFDYGTLISKFNLIQKSYIIGNPPNYNEEKLYFLKGVLFGIKSAIYVYYSGDLNDIPTFIFKNIDNSFSMIDKYEEFPIVYLYDYSFNNDIKYNDLVTTNNEEVFFISSHKNKEILIIASIKIYKSSLTSKNEIVIRYYTLEINKYYNMNIFNGLKAINFRGKMSDLDLTLAIDFCFNDSCQKSNNTINNAALIFLSFPNNTFNIYIDFIEFAFNENKKYLYLNLSENFNIENNIFGYIFSYIEIIKLDYPEGVECILEKTKEILKMDIYIFDEALIKLDLTDYLFNDNTKFQEPFITFYARICLPDELEEFNKYCDNYNDSYGNISDKNSFSRKFKSSSYSNYFLNIKEELTTECYNTNCTLCLSSDIGYCIVCKGNYNITYDEKYKYGKIKLCLNDEYNENITNELINENTISNLISSNELTNKNNLLNDINMNEFNSDKLTNEKLNNIYSDKLSIDITNIDDSNKITEDISNIINFTKLTNNIINYEKLSNDISNIINSEKLTNNELKIIISDNMINDNYSSNIINNSDKLSSNIDDLKDEMSNKSEELISTDFSSINDDKLNNKNDSKNSEILSDFSSSKNEILSDTNKLLDKTDYYQFSSNDNKLLTDYLSIDIDISIEDLLNGKFEDINLSNKQIKKVYEEIKKYLYNNYNGNNTIIKTGNVKIQISSIDEYKNIQELSNIDLGVCGEILKKKYCKSQNDSLIMLKIDIKPENESSTYVQYEIYEQNNKVVLGLEECSGSYITINVPIELDSDIESLYKWISESGYNLFNANDSFYNDICVSFTTQNETDILLYDRRMDYYKSTLDISLCQKGCNFLSYDIETKKAECNCLVNTKELKLDLSEIKFEKNKMIESFYETLDYSNFRVLKCYKLIFKLNLFIKNIGSIIMTVLLFLFLILLIFHFVISSKTINKYIQIILKVKMDYKNHKNDIKENYNINSNNNKSLINKRRKSIEKNIYGINKFEKCIKKKKNKKLDKDEKKEKKKKKGENDKKEKNRKRLSFFNNKINKREINELKLKNSNKILDKKITKSPPKRRKKKFKLTIYPSSSKEMTNIKLNQNNNLNQNLNQFNLIINNIVNEKNSKNFLNEKKINVFNKKIRRHYKIKTDRASPIFENKQKYKEIKNNNESMNIKNEKFNNFENKEIKNKLQQLEQLSDLEINSLSYQEAIIKDKRTYFQYYLSLLRKKHLIIFTFFSSYDYNLISLKLSLFLDSFSLYLTINAFFFNDDTMHKIYKDKGAYNILYQIPQIIYSSLISSIINILLKALSLSDKDIIRIKQEKNIKKSLKLSKVIKKCILIKFIFFFILSLILMVFFWYFISCFCAVYNNTQKILFKDTLISFCFSMIYPFGINLFPGFFRISSLRAKNKDKQCLYSFSKILALI